MKNKKNNLFIYLSLTAVAVFLMNSLLTSCGKTTVLPAASNIDYQVINLSPDLLPVDLYIDQTKKNSTSFYFPTPSGYFALNSIDPPFQIRSAAVLLSSSNILSIDTILNNNVNYTLFITGLKNNVNAQDSVSYILTRDTSSAPTVGRGKVRFVNGSVGSGGIDITANGTFAFTNVAYKSVSKYIELPAGNYDFKAYPTGTTATLLSDLPAITVQDGKVYTLYSKGIVARTDSAAFGLAVFTNLSAATTQ